MDRISNYAYVDDNYSMSIFMELRFAWNILLECFLRGFCICLMVEYGYVVEAS